MITLHWGLHLLWGLHPLWYKIWMEAESTVADKCHGNNKKRNTVKNQILINKKSFALIKEGLLSTKKKFTYKEKKNSLTQK